MINKPTRTSNVLKNIKNDLINEHPNKAASIGIGGLLGGIIVVPLEQRFRRGILIPILLCIGAIGLTYALWSKYWLALGISFGIAMTCNILGTQSLYQFVKKQYLLICKTEF